MHLSGDPVTARQVEKRYGSPIILQVLAREMHRDGYKWGLVNRVCSSTIFERKVGTH